MSASRPLVSVLTPSYNQALWLPMNVRSVAAQTYPHVEQVVMDGGSDDGSVEFLSTCPSVLYRSGPDRGQSHALNMAFDLSRGDIIGWINSDDAYFSESVIADVVDVFERRPEVGVVYGHAALVGPTGKVLQILWVPPFSRRWLVEFNYVIQPAAFVRRAVLSGVLADERFDYSMDRELWLRLSRTTKFARLNRILAIDRHHDNRKSYLRLDLADLDRARLREMYGVTARRRWRPIQKTFKAGTRLAGLRAAIGAQSADAFGGWIDSRWRLLFRQCAVPRKFMQADRRPS